MSAPDWRTRFASVLESHAVQSEMAGEGGEPDYWLRTATAVLDAIKAAGYRLHRDHDFQGIGLRPGEKCVRCGAIRDGILAFGSCELRELREPREPREEP